MFLVVVDVDAFGEGMGANPRRGGDALPIDGVYGGAGGGIGGGQRCGEHRGLLAVISGKAAQDLF